MKNTNCIMPNREFKHKGCKSVVWRYVGPGEAIPISVSAYWEFYDGTRPVPGSIVYVICPDCNEVISLNPFSLDPVDGLPWKWRKENASM